MFDYSISHIPGKYIYTADTLSCDPTIVTTSLGDDNLNYTVQFASSHGLGAVLLQQQPDGEVNPAAFVSRSMSNTEYAQIEIEALAFTWTCECLSNYLVRLTFHI